VVDGEGGSPELGGQALGLGAKVGISREPSPYSVAETVRRIIEVAEARGVTVFGVVDHAAGARSVGLDMPDSRVVMLGNPAVGTPAMLAAPDLALDLPTRLLVREASPGDPASTVVFHAPDAIAREYGLAPELRAGLEKILGIVQHAIRA